MDSVRVLYVEDDPSDVELTRLHVERYATHLKLVSVSTVADAVERILVGDVDVVLSDYRLPDGTGLDLLEAITARSLSVPVVLVTGSGDPATAIQLLRAGAADYLVKRGHYLRSLPQVLEGAVEHHRIAHELRHIPAQILYVEHDRNDVILTERAFQGYGAHLRLEVVSRGREALARLSAKAYDLVLLDYRLPDLSGIEVLRLIRQERIRVPVVMVTGQGDEETVVQAFKLGASDYIVKGASYSAKLPSTVENVLARRRLEDERNALMVLNALSVALATVRDTRELAERVVRSAHDLLNADISILWLRERSALRPAASIGVDALIVPLLEMNLTDTLEARALASRRLAADELRAALVHSPEARTVFDEIFPTLAVSLIASGQLVGLLAVVTYQPRDFATVGERLLTALANHAAMATENLRLILGLAEQVQARERLAAALEATTDLVGIAEPRGRLLYLNRAGRQLMGIGLDEDLAGFHAVELVAEPTRERVAREIVPELARQGTWSGEVPFRSRLGREFPVWAVASAHPAPPHAAEFVSVIARDISERRGLEEQLRQSQKMEGIGQLAAGIAHDFNNLLTVIGGRCDLLLSQIGSDNILFRDLNLINGAAERAVRLTQQLLAFSRRQVLEPQVLDLNATLSGMEPLLRRILGEDIEITVTLGPALGAVKADPGQVEQVLLNFTVNARDAMPRGGRLTLETANTTLDEAYVRRHAGVEAGPYVMVAVGDTGHGMDAATVERIFEPFFTTKEVGKGTGLGLATVFGIVKQSGGHVSVESERGQGTTFRVYLPRVDDVIPDGDQAATPTSPPRGSSTVLLIEDDEDVRLLAREILKIQGYTVLDAQNTADALRLAGAHSGVIHLLLTDVVMPQMNGREVAAQLRRARPELKVLFMSGYADSATLDSGLPSGTYFIQKPFTPDGLGRKVREVLAPNP